MIDEDGKLGKILKKNPITNPDLIYLMRLEPMRHVWQDLLEDNERLLKEVF